MVDVQVGILLHCENKSVKLSNDKLNDVTFDNVFFLLPPNPKNRNKTMYFFWQHF